MARPPSDARDKLLEVAIDYLMENGIGHRSLRQLAEGMGTSHRMLIYHFGSREGLLVAVAQAMERREQQTLADESFLKPGSDLTPAEEMREVWRYATKAEFDSYLRLFFELYGQALQGTTPEFLEGIVENWMRPFGKVFERQVSSKREVRTNARLMLAVLRGLFLDLLATGDKKEVDRCMEMFLSYFETASREATAKAGATPERKRKPRAKGKPKKS
jgi:AcrR family transcriptional regulator